MHPNQQRKSHKFLKILVIELILVLIFVGGMLVALFHFKFLTLPTPKQDATKFTMTNIRNADTVSGIFLIGKFNSIDIAHRIIQVDNPKGGIITLPYVPATLFVNRFVKQGLVTLASIQFQPKDLKKGDPLELAVKMYRHQPYVFNVSRITSEDYDGYMSGNIMK